MFVTSNRRSWRVRIGGRSGTITRSLPTPIVPAFGTLPVLLEGLPAHVARMEESAQDASMRGSLSCVDHGEHAVCESNRSFRSCGELFFDQPPEAVFLTVLGRLLDRDGAIDANRTLAMTRVPPSIPTSTSACSSRIAISPKRASGWSCFDSAQSPSCFGRSPCSLGPYAMATARVAFPVEPRRIKPAARFDISVSSRGNLPPAPPSTLRSRHQRYRGDRGGSRAWRKRPSCFLLDLHTLATRRWFKVRWTAPFR